MQQTASSTDIIIGVDTHKLTHAAVAISALGARLGNLTVPASSKGYQLQAGPNRLHPRLWYRGHRLLRRWRLLPVRARSSAFEVNRPNRQLRHEKGKDDTLDAESAARIRGWPGHCVAEVLARARSR